MKKIIASFIMLPLALSSFATSRIDSLKTIELTNDVAKNKSDIESVKSLVQVSNGVISNQISASQHTLSAFATIATCIGLFLALILPVLAWYIKKRADQVTRNLKEVNTTLETIKKLKDDIIVVQTEVNSTQEIIKNNLSALYQSLQDEEIKAIFKRLEVEPNDIQHYFPKLTTIKLTGNYFDFLKIIYRETIGLNNKPAVAALMLIIQHYPSKAFYDNEVLNMLKTTYVMVGLYLSEITFYQNGVCELVKSKGINDYLYLFENSVIGIGLKETSRAKFTEETFKIWNNLLDIEQKQVIVNLIKDPSKFKEFKSNVPDWGKLLNIIQTT